MNIRRVNRIDQLAQNVPPARDLWPAIAAAIEADRAGASGAEALRAGLAGCPLPAWQQRSRW